MREYTHTHTHTHTSNLKNKGITLIALAITIIILLILTGITIVGLTRNGLFGKTEIAKQKMRYASAKEAVNLKLMEIQVECTDKGEDYNIKKIAEGMKQAENITIEKYYNKGTGSIKDGVTENITDLEGIVVSVDEYSEYKFLIGEKCEIEGVLEGEVTDTTKIEEFVNIEEFEKKAFISESVTDTIKFSYEKIAIVSNKIQILITIKDEENGLNKIEYPDGDILNCNGKKQIGIDYTIEYGVEYVFKITSNNGYIKEVKMYEEEKYVYGKFCMPQLSSNNCEIGEDSYAVTASSEKGYTQSAYKAFDGVTTNNRDDGCWHSNGGTPQWIQIKFPYNIKINKFTIKNRETDVVYENITVRDFKLQGSNDGENWIELGEYINQYGSLVETTFNIEESDLYTYYRWTATSSYGDYYVSIGEIILEEAEYLVKSPAIISSEINMINENSENLYSEIISILEDYNKLKDSDKTKVFNYNKLIEIINRYNNSIKIIDYKMPNLTSDNCKIEGDNYKVTSSSSHNEKVAYKAFDGVTTNNRDDGCWHSNGGTPQWIQIQFPYKIKINKFIIKNRESDAINENITVKDFKLQGSNDGENWIELGEYINQYGSLVETTFNIEKSDLYIYYRWTSTSSYGDYYVSIGEIILNEAEKHDKPYIDIYD